MGECAARRIVYGRGDAAAKDCCLVVHWMSSLVLSHMLSYDYLHLMTVSTSKKLRKLVRSVSHVPGMLCLP